MHSIIKKIRKLLLKVYWHIDKIGDGCISEAGAGNRQSCHVTGLPNIIMVPKWQSPGGGTLFRKCT